MVVVVVAAVVDLVKEDPGVVDLVPLESEVIKVL
jgi:hypothetical protein